LLKLVPGVPTNPPHPPATAAITRDFRKGIFSPFGAADCFANWNIYSYLRD